MVNLHYHYNDDDDSDDSSYGDLDLLLLFSSSCGFTESKSYGPEEYREESINGRHCGGGGGVL